MPSFLDRTGGPWFPGELIGDVANATCRPGQLDRLEPEAVEH